MENSLSEYWWDMVLYISNYWNMIKIIELVTTEILWEHDEMKYGLILIFARWSKLLIKKLLIDTNWDDKPRHDIYEVKWILIEYKLSLI